MAWSPPAWAEISVVLSVSLPVCLWENSPSNPGAWKGWWLTWESARYIVSAHSNWPASFTQNQPLPKGKVQASTQPFGESIIREELGGDSENHCLGSNLETDP